MHSKKYKDVLDFFDDNLKHIKIDKKLIKDLKHFRYGWSTKSDDYIDFLGSNLLGVHTIFFSTLDDINLLKGTLRINNYQELQKEIFNLDGMEVKFKTASNILYQVLVYLMYKLFRSTLSDKDKKSGIRECCLIMQYKMLTSRYSNGFQFQTTESIAVATYNKYSHKFLMKQLGSWQAIFDYRVDVCLDKHSVNYKQMVSYNTENSILLISAIKTKVNGNFNEMYSVFMDVIESGEAMGSESSTFKGGENDMVQVSDSDKGTGIYVSRMLSMAQQRNEFMDMEVIDITSTLFKNIDKDLITKFLSCMSDDKFMKYDKLSKIIEGILTVSFNYLRRRDINVERPELIPKALIDIRTYWSSSKVKNEEMSNIKETLQSKAMVCTGRKTTWLLITLVLSYITYVFLRSLKK